MTKNTKNKLLIVGMIIILIVLLAVIITMSISKDDKENDAPTLNDVEASESATLETVKKNFFGDYVDYPIDLDGNGNTTDDWKIFYKDKERVYLIAADYLETNSEYLDLKTVGMEKNNSYGLFWKKLPTKYETNNKLANSRCVEALLDKENWKDFVVSQCADYALGTPTLELWTDSWNEKYKNTNIIEYGMNEDGYYLGTNEVKPDYIMDLSKTDGYKDSLYYPHSSVYRLCTGYWLASASASKEYNLMRITYNGMIGNDDYTFNTSALRPVVALKTGITAELNESTGIWELVRKSK